MNAFHLLGVAAFLMLSACASGNREGRVQHSFVYPEYHSALNSSKPALAPEPKQRNRTEVKLMACGQVLSFWAGHLR